VFSSVCDVDSPLLLVDETPSPPFERNFFLILRFSANTKNAFLDCEKKKPVLFSFSRGGSFFPTSPGA